MTAAGHHADARAAGHDDAVVWHDVECGAYAADLPLWRALAAAAAGPVLDIGAGTGRVALDLARRGVEVTAVEIDPALVAALAVRAEGLPLTVVHADARTLALGRRFALCLVPMQTIQLLDAPGRRRVLLAAREHLEDGAPLAAALADPLEGFDPGATGDLLPVPDLREVDGVVYASQPVAVRPGPATTAIERVRRRVAADGSLTETVDVVELHHLSPAELEAEGADAGLMVLPRRRIPATAEHIASTVVTLAAPAI
jgi:SAM-dependent methyltransferase